ncbi:unnamed protein product [Effrenium voratum]|nr:unnamed protein product [Effrenium voratum]
MDAADLIEKEAELAWKSRQYDLSKLAKTRTHFGPLGALPPKELPSQDPALKYVTREGSRPLLLPKVVPVARSASRHLCRLTTPARSSRCVSLSRGQLPAPVSAPVASALAGASSSTSKVGDDRSHGKAEQSESRAAHAPHVAKASRYQKLIQLYERACMGGAPGPWMY